MAVSIVFMLFFMHHTLELLGRDVAVKTAVVSTFWFWCSPEILYSGAAGTDGKFGACRFSVFKADDTEVLWPLNRQTPLSVHGPPTAQSIVHAPT